MQGLRKYLAMGTIVLGVSFPIGCFNGNYSLGTGTDVHFYDLEGDLQKFDHSCTVNRERIVMPDGSVEESVTTGPIVPLRREFSRKEIERLWPSGKGGQRFRKVFHPLRSDSWQS